MQASSSCSADPRRLSPREAYRLWAPTYDNELNPLLALEERVLGPLLLPAVTGRDVVDLGCGTGRWLARMLAAGARTAVGIDQSEEMLAQAAGKLGVKSPLLQADCAALPLRDNCADVLLCSFVLGYVADLENFLHEIARIARRRADLFISEFHPGARSRGWRRSFIHRNQVVQIEDRCHSPADVCALLARSGFRLLGCEEPVFGEPERNIFSQCGKAARFAEVCAIPAAVIWHFRPDSEPGTSPRMGSRRAEQGGRQSLHLTGARVALGPTKTVDADIEIIDGRIAGLNTRPAALRKPTGRTELNLDGYLLFPGLINGHDHLEFSLFPRLGNGPYKNFEQWARDIYKPEQSPVLNHRQVPKSVRLWWGGIKNLLCGVTTVC